MEVKLAQELAYLEQEALYGTFVDLQKAYDAMDCEWCLKILEEYGVGPNMLGLIQYFWDNAEMVCRAGGCFGKPSKAYRSVTQGGPVSPRVFNFMVCVCQLGLRWQQSSPSTDLSRSQGSALLPPRLLLVKD